ncbi:hypothetical protein EW145_g5301 [Phellinidium pouzarii]|uniref:Uncharacterized protein n=1 Tax=Phellinidium pouzarii TaxID=167371 RepID=A0A4S4L2B3_9AGAM|nr:hypothetical protein EW145_g5301 [Phellinidium pouzarii]
MCEVFILEFTEEVGIVAWADQDIFDAHSSPMMKNGHLWKIYLGRRIDLDVDDLDGAQFREDLLEEVILFPLRILVCTHNGTEERWETVEEMPGLWATRPVANRGPNENIQEPDDDEKMDTEEADHEKDSCDEEEESESDEDWDSQAEEDEDDAIADAEELDAALDKPEEDQKYNGPVIRHEEYDTADDELRSILADNPGLSRPRNGVDSSWISDSETEAVGHENEQDAGQRWTD